MIKKDGIPARDAILRFSEEKEISNNHFRFFLVLIFIF